MEVALADIVIPSLDASTEEVFRKINRPVKSVTLKKQIEGIKKMSELIEGRLWVEIFIVPGINDSENELKLLKKILTDIKPGKIHINSLDRPPAVKGVRPAGKKKLKEIQKFLLPLNSWIIGPAGADSRFYVNGSKNKAGGKNKILALLGRRPSTFMEIKTVIESDEKGTAKYLRELQNSGKVSKVKEDRGVFYKKL